MQFSGGSARKIQETAANQKKKDIVSEREIFYNKSSSYVVSIFLLRTKACAD